MLAIVLAGVVSGCASGGAPGNPNLVAPKTILAARGDGNATLCVHSAFGDHQYDWIAVAIDNVTVENRTDVFSFEANVPAPHYYLEITAGSAQQQYHLRARVDLAAKGDKALIAIESEKGDWADARPFALPWEHIMDRKVAP